jgi:hypothetical protein
VHLLLLGLLCKILELFNDVLLRVLIEMLESGLSSLFSCLEDLRNLFLLFFNLLNWGWLWDFLNLIRLFFVERLNFLLFVQTQKAI